MSINLIPAALRGLKWSFISAAANVVLVTAVTAQLARILEPAAFGIVAMANILLGFVNYFTAGFEPSIVQKKSLSDEDIRTSFTFSAFVGLLVYIAAFFLAPLASTLMNSAELVTVLRIAALSVILTALSRTASGLIRRKLDFRTLTLIDLAAYIVGYCLVGLYMAYSGYGLWSLVGATLTQNAATLILTYLCIRHSLRPSLHRPSGLHFTSFGGRLSILGFLDFLSFSLDTILIGKFLGPAALGLYTRSMMLVNMPVEYLSTPILKVAFPAFSQLQSDTVKLREAYKAAMIVLGLICIPISFGMIPAARDIIYAILGPKWTDAIPLLQILATLIPQIMLTFFMGSICVATGKINGRIALQVSFVILLAATLVIFSDRDLVTIAGIIVIAHFLRLIGYMILVSRILQISVLENAKTIIPGLAIGAVVFVAIGGTHEALSDISHFARLAVEICIGGLTLAALAIFLPPRQFRIVMFKLLDRRRENDGFRRSTEWLMRRFSG